MKQIILQFVGASDLCSRTIEWFGKGHFSHVDLVMDDGRLLGARSDVVGGSPAGVWPRKPNYEIWSNISRISIDVTEAQYDAFWTFANSKIGTEYNKLGIVGFVTGTSLTNANDLFCSQYGAEAVSASGLFPHPIGLPANKIDPVALYGILSPWGTITTIQ
jgi:hypothetical protein